MSETLNGGKLTALETGFVDRVGRKLRNTLDVWFGPDLPMSPSAPAGTPPRTLDYPVGYNINIQPRNMEPISFDQMPAHGLCADDPGAAGKRLQRQPIQRAVVFRGRIEANVCHQAGRLHHS